MMLSTVILLIPTNKQRLTLRNFFLFFLNHHLPYWMRVRGVVNPLISIPQSANALGFFVVERKRSMTPISTLQSANALVHFVVERKRSTSIISTPQSANALFYFFVERKRSSSLIFNPTARTLGFHTSSSANARRQIFESLLIAFPLTFARPSTFRSPDAGNRPSALSSLQSVACHRIPHLPYPIVEIRASYDLGRMLDSGKLTDTSIIIYPSHLVYMAVGHFSNFKTAFNTNACLYQMLQHVNLVVSNLRASPGIYVYLQLSFFIPLGPSAKRYASYSHLTVEETNSKSSTLISFLSTPFIRPLVPFPSMPGLTKGAQVVVEDARHAIFGVWMGVDCDGKEEGVIGLANPSPDLWAMSGRLPSSFSSCQALNPTKRMAIESPVVTGVCHVLLFYPTTFVRVIQLSPTPPANKAAAAPSNAPAGSLPAFRSLPGFERFVCERFVPTTFVALPSPQFNIKDARLTVVRLQAGLIYFNPTITSTNIPLLLTRLAPILLFALQRNLPERKINWLIVAAIEDLFLHQPAARQTASQQLESASRENYVGQYSPEYPVDRGVSAGVHTGS
ncbi:hypothetical protein EDD22DRAFT_851992 [Suillus occidentalis]|nr:hypothetical protein EDD22DRAFT_851992 [Suillus occidentalis]